MPASASFQKSDAPLGTQTMTFLSAASAAPVSIKPTAAITLTYLMSVLAPLNRRAMHRVSSTRTRLRGAWDLRPLLMRALPLANPRRRQRKIASAGTMGNGCPPVQQIVQIALIYPVDESLRFEQWN